MSYHKTLMERLLQGLWQNHIFCLNVACWFFFTCDEIDILCLIYISPEIYY